MPDTGAPWNIPYVAGTDLVSDWPTDSQTLAEAIADGLDEASLIKQVVQTVKTDYFTTTSTSLVDVTNFSVSITPTSSASKVLVIANYNVSSTSSIALTQLVRDSTNIFLGTETATYNGTSLWNVGDGVSRLISSTTNVFLDSPATTSATTYKLQMRVNSGTGVFNRAGNAADVSVASSITAIEVAA